jgi:hypothetical protein
MKNNFKVGQFVLLKIQGQHGADLRKIKKVGDKYLHIDGTHIKFSTKTLQGVGFFGKKATIYLSKKDYDNAKDTQNTNIGD